jgi:hypothetical protein
MISVLYFPVSENSDWQSVAVQPSQSSDPIVVGWIRNSGRFDRVWFARTRAVNGNVGVQTATLASRREAAAWIMTTGGYAKARDVSTRVAA